MIAAGAAFLLGAAVVVAAGIIECAIRGLQATLQIESEKNRRQLGELARSGERVVAASTFGAETLRAQLEAEMKGARSVSREATEVIARPR